MFDPKTRVLIVDDMSTMRKIVKNLLREMGMSDFTEAADGNLAWDTVVANLNNPFGLIVSDWNMPNCTGLDFLKKVRADERFKKTPFILVTAEAEQAQVAEAVKAGVDQYIVKPFNKDSMTAKVESVHKKYSNV